MSITSRHNDDENDDPTPNIVATTAIQHYFQVLPQKGKPKPGKEWTVYAAIVATTNTCSAQSEACSEEKNINAWVVACATGSKCTALQPALSAFFANVETPPCALSKNQQSSNTETEIQHQCKYLCQEQLKGMVLHDSHAEVLARRGLMKVLLREISDDLAIFEKTKEHGARDQSTHDYPRKSRTLLQRGCDKSNPNEIAYEIKHNIQLHLYISDSPCGDASIYDIAPVYNASKGNSNENINFTGAKIIMPPSFDIRSGDTQNFTPCGEKNNADTPTDKEPKSNGNCNDNPIHNVSIAREKTQITSALRLKSGKSNIPNHLRSFSMSCSDKICKWMVLGLQGHGILNYFLSKPIMLSSVVVSHDHRATASSQKKALERALLHRAQGVLKSIISEPNQRSMKYLPPLPLPVKFHICQEIFPQSKAEAEREAHCASLRRCDGGPRSQSSKKRKLSNVDKVENIAKCTEKKNQRQSPIGISINWQTSLPTSIRREHNESRQEQFGIEQTVGAKGIKQGKKPKRMEDVMKCPSRLSRYALLQDSIDCVRLLKTKGLTTKALKSTPMKELIRSSTETEQHTQKSYQTFKDRKGTKAFIFESAASPLAGWVRSSKDHDFLVCQHQVLEDSQS